jgi:hypothetical protein
VGGGPGVAVGVGVVTHLPDRQCDNPVSTGGLVRVAATIRTRVGERGAARDGWPSTG